MSRVYECQRCGETKEAEELQKNAQGVTRTCKQCFKEAQQRAHRKRQGRPKPEEGETPAAPVFVDLLRKIGMACLEASERLR